jgi:DNA-binding CsgD family transcriptional regulator
VAVASRPLLGRTEELTLLRQRLELARKGPMQVVLIEGEAGIGKTALLQQAMSHVEEAGFDVSRGAAEEIERDRPFGALAEALGLDQSSAHRERAELGRLLVAQEPEESSSPLALGPQLRFRIVEGVANLLERLALERPVALVLDDLHFADPDTLLALHTLAKRLEPLSLAVVGTYRPSPLVPNLELLAESVRARGGLHLSLGSLPDDAAAALVRDVAGAEPGPRLLSKIQAAGGNPFFITELVTAFKEEGSLRVESGVAEVGDVRVPQSLHLIVINRLGALSHDAVELLKVASILGSSFALTDLSTVLGRKASDLMPALDEARRAGMVVETADHLAFRHDLVREALYEDLPPAFRAALHLQAGRALAEAGAPALEVAPHLSRGASPGDADAVVWLERAAREAAPRSPRIAIGLMERALELAAEDDPGRDEMLAGLAESLRRAGRLPDAESVIRDLLGRDLDARLDISLRLTLSGVLMYQGRVPEALAELETALESSAPSEKDHARLLAGIALRRLLSGNLEGATSAGQDAVALGEKSDERLAMCEALCALAYCATWIGEVVEGAHLAERAVDTALRDRSGAARQFHPWGYQGVALLYADRLDESAEALRTGRNIAEEAGAPGDLTLNHNLYAMNRYLAGEWDDAVAEAEASLALAEETGVRAAIVSALSVIALVGLHRDDLAAAERALEEAEQELAVPGSIHFNAHWAMAARALLLEAGGDPTAAASLLGSAWDHLTAIGLQGAYRFLGSELVRLSLATGDRDRAAVVTESVERVADRAEVPTARGAALRCRGMLEKDPDILVQAVGAYREGPRSLATAWACEEAGSALGRDGRVEEGVPLLEEAVSAFEKVGAAREIARVESALRELGIRRGKRGARRRPASGWESLTPTEVEVVRLAAEALTNAEIGSRLFISRRTVETHLSHVFRKLGLSSRVELASQASEGLALAARLPE